MKTIMMQFLDELKKGGYNIPLEHYNSMLEIEKEQIMNAFSRGLGTELSDWENSQQYYDRTYNQNK